jgi:small subunit ribosomal protein S20
MANSKSAEKRHRQNVQQRERNRAQRSRLRKAVKNLRQAVASGDAAKANELLPATLATVDKTAQKKVIHANAAARTKSRLSKAVGGLG